MQIGSIFSKRELNDSGSRWLSNWGSLEVRHILNELQFHFYLDRTSETRWTCYDWNYLKSWMQWFLTRKMNWLVFIAHRKHWQQSISNMLILIEYVMASSTLRTWMRLCKWIKRHQPRGRFSLTVTSTSWLNIASFLYLFRTSVPQRIDSMKYSWIRLDWFGKRPRVQVYCAFTLCVHSGYASSSLFCHAKFHSLFSSNTSHLVLECLRIIINCPQEHPKQITQCHRLGRTKRNKSTHPDHALSTWKRSAEMDSICLRVHFRWSDGKAAASWSTQTYPHRFGSIAFFWRLRHTHHIVTCAHYSSGRRHYPDWLEWFFTHTKQLRVFFGIVFAPQRKRETRNANESVTCRVIVMGGSLSRTHCLVTTPATTTPDVLEWSSEEHRVRADWRPSNHHNVFNKINHIADISNTHSICFSGQHFM